MDAAADEPPAAPLATARDAAGVDLRLDLWNAELRGIVSTDKGTLRLHVVVQNDRSVLIASVTPSAGERGIRWEFHPAEALRP